jgi:hypothetical protein
MNTYRLRVCKRLMDMECPLAVRTHACSAATALGRNALKAAEGGGLTDTGSTAPGACLPPPKNSGSRRT